MLIIIIIVFIQNIFNLLSTFFVFDIAFPKSQASMLTFCQKKLMNFSDSSKRNLKVISLVKKNQL